MQITLPEDMDEAQKQTMIQMRDALNGMQDEVIKTIKEKMKVIKNKQLEKDWLGEVAMKVFKMWKEFEV